MKKALFVAGLALLLVACTVKKTTVSDAKKIKEEYESYNGKIREKTGLENRTVSIDEDNPFVYITSDELIKKIENKENFYLYFGSPVCPWCRSSIEMAIETAKENNIETVYYLNIWDENGNEIFRDLYSIVNGNLIKKTEGDPNYYKFLEYFDAYLDDYVLMNGDEEVMVGEKRLYIPLYLHIENGDIIQMSDAQADSQTDANQKLTEQIKTEQKEKLETVFKTSNACSIETRC